MGTTRRRNGTRRIRHRVHDQGSMGRDRSNPDQLASLRRVLPSALPRPYQTRSATPDHRIQSRRVDRRTPDSNQRNHRRPMVHPRPATSTPRPDADVPRSNIGLLQHPHQQLHHKVTAVRFRFVPPRFICLTQIRETCQSGHESPASQLAIRQCPVACRRSDRSWQQNANPSLPSTS